MKQYENRKLFRSFISALIFLFTLNVALPASADAITYIERLANSVSVPGLQGISDVAVSPDGKFVYTASYSSHAISVFSRDSVTGRVVFSSIKTPVSTAFSVATSPDNKSVYAASPNGVIYAFSRNEQTGELTQVNTLGGSPTAGFVSVSVSPNGKFVYGVGGQPSGLVVFARDAATSAITRVADYPDNVNGLYLGQMFGPTTSPIKNIVSSADGQYVYVTSTTDNAVSLFSQNQATGELTSVAAYRDGVSGFDGLQGASSAKMSPDGKHLYVAGQGESSVAILAVNSTTGELTYINKISDGVNGVTTIEGARSLAISPDGRYVLVSAIVDKTVTAFSRDSTTGLLTFDSVATDTVNGVVGLNGPSGMSTDPLNRHLYVAGQASLSLVVFSLPTPAVQLSVTQAAALVSGPAITLDSQLEVYDSDSPNLASATISISEGFLSTDLLSVTASPGITPSYSAGTGVLTLTGSATLANYRDTLRSLTYQAGADVTLSPGQLSARKVSIVVSDTDGNTSAASIVAVSVEKPLTFAVSFVDWDGTTLSSQTIPAGTSAVSPTPPSRIGYTFTGWDVAFSNIVAATTITAQYAIDTFTVTFDLNGGTGTGGGNLIQTVNYGGGAVAPVVSAPLGKIFSGWSTDFNNVTGNITVVAQYANSNYTVTATLTGQASATPLTQQVQLGSSGILTINRTRSDDIVRLTSNCNATLSGDQITTGPITADCVIGINVFAATKVTRENETALAVNASSRFTLTGGEGTKSLAGAMLKRSGEEVIVDESAGKTLVTTQSDGSYIFSASRTGRYSLVFVDAVSNENVTVVFDVLPYVAFTASKQPVQQNTATKLRLWLSDEPIEYPVVVKFTTAGATVSAEQFEFSAEDNLRHTYDVTATAGTASITLVKDGLVSAIVGTPAVQTLSVQQLLPALALSVTATQGGQHDVVVTRNGGAVSLMATELNGLSPTYTWSASGLVLTPSGATATIDVSAVPEGMYTVSVQGGTTDARTGRYDLALRVIADCALESCAGTGTSGIPATANPFVTTPNRLAICPAVAGTTSRVANCAASTSLFAEVPNQYALSLGSLAGDQSWKSGQFGLAVSDKSLEDPGFTQLIPVVNFDVSGLDHPGEAVSIALPLPNVAIPQNAIWRKYINSKWQNFVLNADNKLHSAARDPLGQCPGVSSDVWEEGLIAGRECVRLTIEDGGPNDADGLANGTIRDPGVLAVEIPPVPPVPPVTPVKDGKVKSGGGSIDALCLLLLCVFCLARYRKILTLVLLLPLPALALDAYVGLEGAIVKTSVDSGDVKSEMLSAGITGTAKVDDSSRTGWRVYAGLPISNQWSVELGWLDMGDITTRFGGIPAAISSTQLSSISPHSGDGFELGARWIISNSFDQFKPSVRAGLWRMDIKNRYADLAETSKVTDHDYVPFVGADAQWLLTEHWSAKLGASHYYTEEYGTTTVNLGAVYKF